jgi:NitT/TauT family transport system substrate-binding protein
VLVKPRIVSATALGVLMLAVAACGRSAPTTLQSPPPSDAPAAAEPAAPSMAPVTVRAGFTGATGDAPAVIADKRGYFATEGLQLALSRVPSSVDAIPLLATGEIDVNLFGVTPAFFNAIGRGIDLQIVAEGGRGAPGFDVVGLAVRTDLVESGRYARPADLKGMKIGLNALYGANHYLIKTLLEQHGLTLADVDVVVIPLDQAAIALQNKNLEAWVTFEPFLSQSEQLGVGRVVLRSQTATFNPTGTFTNLAFLRGMLAWHQQEGLVKDPIDLDRAVNLQFVEKAAQRLPPP